MARRKGPKKDKPIKQDWRRMLEADPLVQELVHRHHKHLERAKIVILGKPRAGKSHGKTNVAKAKRATPEMQALIKELAGEDVHYVILVGLDAWDKLDMKQRRIVLDHELLHFTGLDAESGKWGVTGHDVEAFTAEIQRYGAWNVDLQLFFSAVKQMPLDLQPA